MKSVIFHKSFFWYQCWILNLKTCKCKNSQGSDMVYWFLLWKKCINICCWIYVSLYLHFYLYLRGCFAPFSFCGRCDGKIAAGELILLLLLCSNCKKCSNCKNCFNTILLESWTYQKFHLLWNGKNIKCEIFFP